MRFRLLIALGSMAFAMLGTPAMLAAHTRVVASTPAQGTTVARPRVVTLTFNEALLPPTVATSLVMTAMPGMANHTPTTIRNVTSAWSNGNKTLTLTLRQALRAGSYDVRWQAAGADGHRMRGTVSFTVS